MSAADEEFDSFVRAHAAEIRRYAMSIVRDKWLAEDVTQEAFLRAWRFWPSQRDESTRRAWAFRICRNVAFDALKARDRRRGQGGSAARVGSRNLPANLATVLQLPARDAGLAWVDEVSLLKQLSLQHREVIALVDVLGFDYTSAAEVLACPVGTVRSRLKRARENYQLLNARAEGVSDAG